MPTTRRFNDGPQSYQVVCNDLTRFVASLKLDVAAAPSSMRLMMLWQALFPVFGDRTISRNFKKLLDDGWLKFLVDTIEGYGQLELEKKASPDVSRHLSRVRTYIPPTYDSSCLFGYRLSRGIP